MTVPLILVSLCAFHPLKIVSLNHGYCESVLLLTREFNTPANFRATYHGYRHRFLLSSFIHFLGQPFL